jgi:hypothetical protein
MTGAYGRLQRYRTHARAAPISLRTASHPHLARLDRPGPVAELPGPPQGRRRGPSTADPAATDESALETRADALSGRCARCRGDRERAVPGLGTRANGRALGGGWRDHLATCQGSKVATRRQTRGHIGPRRGRIGLRRRFKRRSHPAFYAHEAPMAPLEGPVGRTGGPRGRETHKRLPACSENEHASSRTAHDPASASWRLACCTRQVRCIRGSIGRFQRSSRRPARLARRHAADSVLRAAHLARLLNFDGPEVTRGLTRPEGGRGDWPSEGC